MRARSAVVGLWSLVFVFKQKTAYEMRISDWSSDVCSSDLLFLGPGDACCRIAPDLSHFPAIVPGTDIAGLIGITDNFLLVIREYGANTVAELPDPVAPVGFHLETI